MFKLFYNYNGGMLNQILEFFGGGCREINSPTQGQVCSMRITPAPEIYP